MPILLPLLAALIPLIILPGVLFYFDITPKVTVALVGAAIACCLYRRNAVSVSALLRTENGRHLLISFAAITVALVVACFASSNPWLSFAGSNWRRYGLITQLALLVLALLAAAEVSSGRTTLGPTLRSVAASSIFVSLYTIAQYFGWDPLQPSSVYQIGEGEWTIVRPPSTLGHANYLGTYLCFSVFLSVVLLRSETIRMWRAIAAAAIAAGGAAIVLCGSRSAIAGAIAGVAVLIVHGRPRARTVFAAAAIGAVVLSLFYISPWGAKLRGRARWYREDVAGGARFLMWRDSMPMFLARPLAGWGPETFSTEFPRFQSTQLARSYPDFYHESPHNVFIDELTAKGLLGFAAFALLCVLALRAPLQDLSAPLIAALVNLQFTALVASSAFFFFLIAALIIAGKSKPADPARPFLFTLGLPLALLFVVCATRLAFSDLALEATRSLLARNDAPSAIARYDIVRRWQLPGMTSDLYYSRAIQQIVRAQPDFNAAVKTLQEALQAGVRATQISEDRHNAFYSLANIYAVMNNMRDTESSLRKAIDAAPNWYKPHWMLARTLRLQRRIDEAKSEAQIAVDLGGSKHAEVRDTLRLLTTPK